MTEPTRDLGRAFAGLSQAVRERTVPPPAASVRKRAEHQLRVRRTTTALVAAAAVAAIAVGGITVLRDTAVPAPPRPADSGTPTPRPSTPTATPPAGPDLITEVSWQRATVVVPAMKGCPSGRLQFRADRGAGGGAYSPAKYPRLYIDPSRVAYGDLTGDGRPEAVMNALCLDSEEDSGDGRGQLVVISRNGSDLRLIAWVGPNGAVFSGFWIEDRTLVVEAVSIYDNSVNTALGEALAYRWTPQGFVSAPSGYPALVATDGRKGPAIDIRAVATRTGCPATALHFDRDGNMRIGDDTWNLMVGVPKTQSHVVDLDGTGHRWVLVRVDCNVATGGNGVQHRNFLAVLERITPDQFRAVDAIVPPAGQEVSGWEYQDGELRVDTAKRNGAGLKTTTYRWRDGRFTP